MLCPAQPVPAKEEQSDHGGLQEEGHQALNRQWRPENVPHVVRVVGPVGAELELEGDACGDTQCEVDAKQLAPKARHVFPDHIAGHDIDTLHDHQEPDHAEGEGDEEKVVHGSSRKLQPRQVHQLFRNHGWVPFAFVGAGTRNWVATRLPSTGTCWSRTKNHHKATSATSLMTSTVASFLTRVLSERFMASHWDVTLLTQDACHLELLQKTYAYQWLTEFLANSCHQSPRQLVSKLAQTAIAGTMTGCLPRSVCVPTS